LIVRLAIGLAIDLEELIKVEAAAAGRTAEATFVELLPLEVDELL